MGIEFVLTSLVLAVTPGTGVLYTVTAGLSRGARTGLVAAVGCTLGIVPHVAAAVTGLAALLHTSAVAGRGRWARWPGPGLAVDLRGRRADPDPLVRGAGRGRLVDVPLQKQVWATPSAR